MLQWSLFSVFLTLNCCKYFLRHELSAQSSIFFTWKSLHNNYCSSRPGFKIPSGDRGRWSTSCLPTRAYVQRKRTKMKEFRLSLCFLFPVLTRGYGGPLKTRFKIYCRRILYDWYWDEYSVCRNSYLWRITKCYKTWTILFFSLLQIKITLHRTC